VTLNDLEGRNGRYFALSYRIRQLNLGPKILYRIRRLPVSVLKVALNLNHTTNQNLRRRFAQTSVAAAVHPVLNERCLESEFRRRTDVAQIARSVLTRQAV